MSAFLDLVERILGSVCQVVFSLCEGNEYQVLNLDSLCSGSWNFLYYFSYHFLYNFFWLSVQLFTKRVDLVVHLADIPNFEIVCSVGSQELVVHTDEQTELCGLLAKTNGIARAVCQVPDDSWLCINLPCLFAAEVPCESKACLGSQLCVVTCVVGADEVVIAEADVIAYTGFYAEFECAVGFVFRKEISEIECTV